MDLPFRFNANVDLINRPKRPLVELELEVEETQKIFGPKAQIYVEGDGLIHYGFKPGLPVVRFTLDLAESKNVRWLRDVHYGLLSSEPGIWLEGLGDENMDLHLVEMCPGGQFRFAALHSVPV